MQNLMKRYKRKSTQEKHEKKCGANKQKTVKQRNYSEETVKVLKCIMRQEMHDKSYLSILKACTIV